MSEALHLGSSRSATTTIHIYIYMYIYVYISLESRTSCSSKCNLLRCKMIYNDDRPTGGHDRKRSMGRENVAPPPSSSPTRVPWRPMASYGVPSRRVALHCAEHHVAYALCSRSLAHMYVHSRKCEIQ